MRNLDEIIVLLEPGSDIGNLGVAFAKVEATTRELPIQVRIPKVWVRLHQNSFTLMDGSNVLYFPLASRVISITNVQNGSVLYENPRLHTTTRLTPTGVGG